MVKFRYFIVLFLIIFTGCRKENEPPIVEPGSYYPAYPNSWWKYLVNNSYIQIDSTSDDYIVHSFKVDGDPDRYSDPARVPFLNGEPIYGYYFVEDIYYPSTSYDGIQQLWPILSETVGFTFHREWNDERMGDPEEIVCVKSKTFNGQDSILILESYWYSWSIPNAILDNPVKLTTPRRCIQITINSTFSKTKVGQSKSAQTGQFVRRILLWHSLNKASQCYPAS